MSKIEIDKSIFSKFINLISLMGDLENKEMLLNISEKEMVARVASASKILILKGVLKGKFEAWGDIGIDNLAMFKNVLTSINIDKLDLNKTDNKIMLAGNKIKYSGVLRNPKYIINSMPADKMENLMKSADGNNFILKSPDIKQILHYASAISPNFIIFKCKNNNLTVNLVNQDNEMVLEFPVSNIEDFEIKVAKAFLNVLQPISEFDITCSIKNDNNILLKIADENIKFEYLYAPLKK